MRINGFIPLLMFHEILHHPLGDGRGEARDEPDQQEGVGVEEVSDGALIRSRAARIPSSC